MLTEGKQLLKAEALCLLGNPSLQDFHIACCHQGLPLTHLGPMGKVWESGVVQVVQHAGNLATDVHPLNLLPPDLALSSVDEIVYLPIYDAAPNSPVQGVVAALELMVSPRSTDVMVVANLISTVSEVMVAVGLALSNPQQQPHHYDSSYGKPHYSIVSKSAPPGIGGGIGIGGGSGMQMRNESFDVNNQAWATASARSFGSGGGLARTASVRALGDFRG